MHMCVAAHSHVGTSSALPIHRLCRTFHALVVLLHCRGACRCGASLHLASAAPNTPRAFATRPPVNAQSSRRGWPAQQARHRATLPTMAQQQPSDATKQKGLSSRLLTMKVCAACLTRPPPRRSDTHGCLLSPCTPAVHAACHRQTSGGAASGTSSKALTSSMQLSSHVAPRLSSFSLHTDTHNATGGGVSISRPGAVGGRTRRWWCRTTR